MYLEWCNYFTSWKTLLDLSIVYVKIKLYQALYIKAKEIPGFSDGCHSGAYLNLRTCLGVGLPIRANGRPFARTWTGANLSGG